MWISGTPKCRSNPEKLHPSSRREIFLCWLYITDNTEARRTLTANTIILIRATAELGSLIPSSRFLVDRLLAKVDWERARTIVEYGPGVGTITAHILSRMSPHTRLVAFEMNEDFVCYLKRTFPDPRLHVVHGSAANVQRELDRLKLDGADYIISGIPFTTMPVKLREKIMAESREALRPGGAVLVYQFTRAVLPYLRSHFNQIDQDFEPRNILPARLFYCTQDAA
jgi:phospholipid N-methyltransferase